MFGGRDVVLTVCQAKPLLPDDLTAASNSNGYRRYKIFIYQVLDTRSGGIELASTYGNGCWS